MKREEQRGGQATLLLPIDEWVQLRHQLAADHTQDLLLHKLTEEIEIIADTHPDRAADIIAALTASSHSDDRVTAAINIGALFDTRPQRAKELLGTLLQDPDEQISEKAFETLEEIIETGALSTGDAARLAQARFTRLIRSHTCSQLIPEASGVPDPTMSTCPVAVRCVRPRLPARLSPAICRLKLQVGRTGRAPDATGWPRPP